MHLIVRSEGRGLELSNLLIFYSFCIIFINFTILLISNF